MLRLPLRGTFALFPVLQLRGLVSWESLGRYFMIGRFLWDLFGALSCRFLEYCSAVWCSAADSHLKLLDRVVRSADFLAGGVLECNLAHRRSVAELCMLFKIKSNPMHPLIGALPLSYVPARVTLGASVAHRHSFAPPRCKPSQYRRSFVDLSVSLWNDLVTLCLMVWDWRVSRAESMLSCWHYLLFLFLSPTVLSFSSFHGLVVWGCCLRTDRVSSLSPGNAQQTPK